MVAIVSGNSLGLSLTSANTLGSQGVYGDPTQGRGAEQVYVNAATGNLVMQQQQNLLASTGLDVASVLTYNSLGLLNDDNGDNFSLGKAPVQLQLSNTVNTAGSTLKRTGFDGAQAVYTWDAAHARYVSTAGGGAFDTITRSGATYTWTDGATQQTETYNASGRLLTRADADGNAMTFGYDATTGLLTSVTDASGEKVSYVYSGTLLTQITTPVTTWVNGVATTSTQSVVSYAYDTSNRLASVTVDLSPDGSTADGNVYKTWFTYADTSTRRVQTMQQTDGTSLTFGYDTSNRVHTITDAQNNVTTYAYDTTNRKTSVVVDGQTTTYGYDAAGNLTSVAMAAVNGATPTTTFAYNANGDVTSMVDADGRTTSYGYDANGNPVSVLDSAGDLTTRTYDAQNRLLTETTSPQPTTVPLVNANGMTINGGTVTKTGGANITWDSSVQSATGLTGAATVSFTAGPTADHAMVGLNSDPSTDAGYGSIDYALYMNAGSLMVYANGTPSGTIGTYVQGDALAVSYDGAGHVSYIKNGQVLCTMASSVTTPLFVDSSFYESGSGVTNLAFATGATTALVNANGMTINGGAVTKTGGANVTWDSSVQSATGLTGAATVSFTAGPTADHAMVGLNSDPSTDAGYGSIDYALYMNAGSLMVYANGTPSGTIGTYVQGDALAVSYDGAGHVSYVKNGQVLSTMAATVTTPLFVDSSFYESGSGVTNLAFAAGATTALVNANGMTINGGAVTKTGGANVTWDSSVQSATGLAGAVTVSFKAGPTADHAMVGLNSDPAPDNGYATIDYALYTSAGSLMVYANGTPSGTIGTYVQGDALAVSYDGAGHVSYIKNGQVLSTMAAAVTTPLFVDSSFYESGSGVTNLTFGPTPMSGETTRHVYSADGKGLLRFKITPQGDVTEYGYNAQGALVSTNVYAKASYPSAGLPAGVVPTEAAMVAWRTAQDLTQTQRTDIARDTRQQVTATTTYQATAADGTGMAAGASSAHYVYDPSGHLMQVIKPGSATTTYVYDGLGRTVSTTDALNRTRTIVHADAAGTVTTTAPSGLVTVATFDRQGRQVAATSTMSGASQGTTTDVYDALGNLLESTDATGVHTFHLYDAENRRVADVDGNGVLTEVVYSASNRVTETITYATPISTAALVDSAGHPLDPSLALVRPALSAADEHAWTVYDDAGRAVQSINAVGTVTQLAYDGDGHVVSTTVFATPVNVATLGAAPALVTVAPSVADQVTHDFYDADGHVTGVVDPTGTLTEYQYDAAGQRAVTIRYATPALASSSATTLAQARPASSAADQRSVTLYDMEGRVTGTIDPLGTLTETVYNPRSTIDHTTRYGTSVGTAVAAGMAVASIRPATTTADQTTSWLYDAQDRVASSTDATGTVTSNVYDTTTDELLSTTQASSQPSATTTQTRYDAMGRVIATLDGVGSAAITGGMTVAQVNAVWAQHATTTTYDLAGRRASVTDALGNRTSYFYDNDGQLRYTVDPANDVVEARYDAFGNVTSTIAYAAPINAAGIGAGGLVTAGLTSAVAAIANAAADHVTSKGYDAANRVVRSVDATGAVTQTSYDAFGNVARVIDPLNNTTRYLYDGANRLRYTLDALYHLTENDYDAFGHVVATIAYNDAQMGIQTFGLANGVIANSFAWINPNAALDRVTRYAYDADGRQVFAVDPTGIVTQTGYDALGNVVTRTRYATPIDLPTAGSTDGKTVTVSGNFGGLTGANYAAIDPTHTYTVTARMRQVSGTGTVYVGAVTKDANGNVLSNAGYGGYYAYCAASNALLTPDMGWVTYTGTISGTQTTSSSSTAVTNKFYAGSASAAPLILYNYYGTNSDPGRDVEIDSLTLTDTTTNTVLNIDPALANGASSLAMMGGSIDAVQSSATASLTASQIQARLRVSAGDQVTRYAYDQDGRQVFAIDPTGIVTQTGYDALGNVVTHAQYATPIDLPTAGSADGKTVTVSGNYGGVTGANYAAIDPTHTYTVTARMRQVSGTGSVYVGVATKDANGNTITNAGNGGTYVYCSASGSFLTPDMGWVTYTGTISGTQTTTAGGTSVLNKFFAGSVSASPLILYNYYGSSGDPGRDVEIDSLTLTDTTTNTVLNVDPSLVNGANSLAMWSGTVDNVQSSTAASLTAAQIQARLRVSAGDQVTRYAYDQDGRQVFAVDPAGIVTQTGYDALGNVVTHAQYATPIDLPTAGSADGKTVTVSGNYGGVTGANYAAIDPTHTYTVTARMRQLSGSGTVYVGVVTKDANGNILSNAGTGGYYAYCAASDALLTPDIGWVTYTGTISGTQTTSSSSTAVTNKFYAGSASATPLIYYNYYGTDGDPGRDVEIDSITLTDTTTNTVLNIDPALVNGASSLAMMSGSIDAVQSSTAASLTADQIRARLRLNSTSDRVTRNVYDADGREVLTVDPTGAATQFTYDAVGNVTQTRQLATLVPAGNALQVGTDAVNSDASRSLGMFGAGDVVTATVLFKAPAGSQGSMYIGGGGADGQSSGGVASTGGWQKMTVTYTVPAGGKAMGVWIYGSSATSTPVVYDDLRITSVQQGTVLDDNFNSDSLSNWSLSTAGVASMVPVSPLDAGTDAQLLSLVNSVQDGARDRIMRDVYDADGRKVLTVDPTGAATQFTYDAAGNVTQTRHLTNIVPTGNGLQVNYAANTNSSAALLLGAFQAGDVVTATVRFKAAPGANGRSVVGRVYVGDGTSAGGTYGNITPATGGWQTLTVTYTVGATAQSLYVYVYGNRDGAPIAGDSVTYDNLRVTSVQQGVVTDTSLDTIATGAGVGQWSFASSWQTAVNSLADAGTDAQLLSLVNSMQDNSRDRITRDVHDADGRTVLTVDPSGAATQFTYNAVGNVTQARQLATLVPAGNALQVGTDAVNSDASRSLGMFATGDVVTATVLFKAPAGSQGSMYIGNGGAAGQSSGGIMSTGGWQKMTVTYTVPAGGQAMGVWIYGSSATSTPVIYDDLRITSVQQGTVLDDNFNSDSLTNWSLSTAGVASMVHVSSVDAGADTQLLSLVNSVQDGIRDRITRNVYDADGRKVLTADPTGAATQFTYDAVGNVTQTRQLATLVPAGNALQVGTDAVNSDASRSLGMFAAGDVVTATVLFKAPAGSQGSMYIGGGGADGQSSGGVPSTGGWQKMTVTYTVPAGGKAMGVWIYGSSATSTPVVYDDLRITSVQQGTVLDDNFNGDSLSNWSLSTTGVASMVPVSPLDAGTDAQLLSLANSIQDSARDRITRNVYDADGHEVLTVDPTGAATQFTHDPAGDVTQTRQLANTVPTGNGLQVDYAANTNCSGALLLGTFQVGDVVTATVRFKATPGANGRSVVGNIYVGDGTTAGGTYGVITPATGGWQTLTVTRTVGPSAQSLYVYVYGNRDGAPIPGDSVTYDNLRVTSAQQGVVTDTSLDTIQTGAGVGQWSFASPWQTAVNSLADAGTDAQLMSLVNSMQDNSRDRITRDVRDADERTVLTVDPTGAATQFTYDAVGNVIQTRQLAVSVPAGNVVQVSYVPNVGSFGALSLGSFVVGDTITATVRFKSDSTVNGQIYVGDGTTPGGNCSATVPGNNGWQTVTISRMVSSTAPMFVYIYGGGTPALYSGLSISSVQRGVIASDACRSAVMSSAIGQWMAYSTISQAAISPADAGADAQLAAYVNANVNNTGDRVTRSVYDADGRMTYSVGAQGLVTAYTYDNFGNVSSKTVYGTPIDTSTLGSTISATDVTSRLVPNAAIDRTTRNLHDAFGRLVLTVDPAGQATQTTYDAYGNVAQTRQLATPVPSGNGVQIVQVANVRAVHQQLGLHDSRHVRRRATYGHRHRPFQG